MLFEVKKLPDQPIVLFEPTEDFKLGEALPIMIEEVTKLLDSLDAPVFYIPDMRQATIGLDDILLGMNQVAFGSRAFLKHPNIREVLLITHNRVIKKIANGLGSGLYGSISIRVFSDREAALAYAKQKTGQPL